MDKLYKYKDVVQMLVDVIEQAEQNNDIVIVDRPMGWESIRDYAEEVVSDIPSAEPKKGEWRTSKAYPHIVFCDECGEPFERSNTEHFNFCPNCGARMKGADDA